jgi:hypothetical protein
MMKMKIACNNHCHLYINALLADKETGLLTLYVTHHYLSARFSYYFSYL